MNYNAEIASRKCDQTEFIDLPKTLKWSKT